MSEYQYYEFQAVDRPLTREEMADLRAISTRARISPTRLQNVYHYGDFKGDPLELMEQYFDAFVYVANWGTNQFMVRLPRAVIDAQAARAYASDDELGEDGLMVHNKGDVVILEFISQDDEGGGWIEDEESEAWMPALLPLRAELAGGDLRALYLAWLAASATGEFEDMEEEIVEPPVPPGLGKLSASLKSLASFLRVSDELLAVAAARSPAMPAAPSPDDLQRWIASLPTAEKDALLFQLASNGPQAQAEITRRFHHENRPPLEASAGGRTVAQLLAEADELAEEVQRREVERQAAERARYLDSLVEKEDALWRQIDDLVETKRPREYDQAVLILQDLSALADHVGEGEAFAARLDSLRGRYAKRSSLLQRLDRADLLA